MAASASAEVLRWIARIVQVHGDFFAPYPGEAGYICLGCGEEALDAPSIEHGSGCEWVRYRMALDALAAEDEQ